MDWFPLGWIGLISWLSKELLRVFSNTTAQKHQFFGSQPSLWSQLSHPYMTIGQTIALTIWTFVGKVMSLLFNTLFRFVIVFLPRSKCLWISWLQSQFTVILEPKKTKSVTVSTFPPSICHEAMGLGTGCLDLLPKAVLRFYHCCVLDVFLGPVETVAHLPVPAIMIGSLCVAQTCVISE